MLGRAGETDYHLLLDGVPVLTRPRDPLNSDVNQLIFGDGTCQAQNASVEIDHVRFQQGAAICHRPDTPAAQTQMVPAKAAAGHLRHGDTEGVCGL